MKLISLDYGYNFGHLLINMVRHVSREKRESVRSADDDDDDDDEEEEEEEEEEEDLMEILASFPRVLSKNRRKFWTVHFPPWTALYSSCKKKKKLSPFYLVTSLTSSKHFEMYCCFLYNHKCLFVCVLWHINLCRLFNAKFIFIQIISSISNNSV